MHYDGSNSFWFANATEIYQFKANCSEVKKRSLAFRKFSKDFTSNDMKITGLNGYFYEFSVDYNIIDTSNINIHKYLIEKHDIK